MSHVQSTSLEAFYGEVVPTLSNRHRSVLQAFTEKEAFTNAELAEHLGWPINTVTPRVLELRQKGYLVFDKQRKCNATRRTAIAWKAKLAQSTLF